MPGNTTRRHQDGERRSSPRVHVLFSALLNRRGWRTQIVEVLDLSEDGAKVQLRFPLLLGAEATLRIPGPSGKLEIPAAVVNACEEHGLPVAGLKFSVPDRVRRELAEIVERVDRLRRSRLPAPPARPARRGRGRRAAPDTDPGPVV